MTTKNCFWKEGGKMFVNGEKMDLASGMTVSQLLDKLNINAETVAVEVDLELVDKEQYKSKKLSSSSKVEIIRYVGGG
ncbi:MULTISPECIES: sulfur carrier protein ThiS [Clostridium]|jgi:sulfur carrier protein|uniref:Sulfur carrier protein ThiS n=1 Tax=Clostridium lapidicellarium TaxID=3240931 RepID=A0ABV4E0W4_9CLOT